MPLASSCQMTDMEDMDRTGHYVQGGVGGDGSGSEERIAAVDANVENLARFTEYANSKGVASGLWTESNLSPDSDEKTLASAPRFSQGSNKGLERRH